MIFGTFVSCFFTNCPVVLNKAKIMLYRKGQIVTWDEFLQKK